MVVDKTTRFIYFSNMHTLWLWRKSTLISPLKCWLKPSNSFLLGISPKMPFLLVSFTLETWTERNGCFPLPISGLEAKHFYGDITQLTTRYLFVYSALRKELRHGAARECEDETFLQIFIYFQLLRMLSMRGTTETKALLFHLVSGSSFTAF